MTARLAAAVERSFLSALPPHEVEALLAGGHEIAVAARAIAAPSAYPSNAALIVDGLVRMYVTGPNGREATVGYRRCGDFLLPFTDKLPPVRLQALTPTRAWLLPLASVQRAMEADARVAVAVTRHAGAMFYATVAEFRFGIFSTVRQRVARHLLAMAVPGDDGRDIVLASVQEVADAIGSVREVVSREIRDLVRRRAVSLLAHGVVLLRPELLREEIAPLVDDGRG